MKILALLTDGLGARGGIARYNRDLLSALAASTSVEEVVVLPRFGVVGSAPPSKVTQLPPRGGRATWGLAASRISARRKFDAILCGHLHAVPLAALLSRTLRRPMWLQVHGIEAWQRPSSLTRGGTERSHLVTSVSRYTRARLLQWANIDPARVRVLPNTVAENFGPRARRADLMARHQLQKRKVVLTVGRIAASERYKGHDRVIRAIRRLVPLRPEIVYLIVGSGDDQPRLAEMARQAGVTEHVRFAGEVAETELPDYFALADVFAMPSTGEGFGIVFLEAARSGLPVIGGNGDGSIDALADGRIGRAIDPQDVGALADAIVEALEGRNTPDPSALARFEFKNFAKQVDELVRHIA